MGPTKSALQYTCSGCYPKKMNGKQEEIHNILVALLSGKEEEIYNVLYKKKEIDDKTPKLRTEDEKKKLLYISPYCFIIIARIMPIYKFGLLYTSSHQDIKTSRHQDIKTSRHQGVYHRPNLERASNVGCPC